MLSECVATQYSQKVNGNVTAGHMKACDHDHY